MYHAETFRQARVAGTFYPGSASDLRQYFQKLGRTEKVPAVSGKLRALISPHAGYIYSAPIAFSGFQLLQTKQYDTVIILAPSHYDDFRGISIYPGDGYSTPLGEIEVDHDIAQKLIQNRSVTPTNLGHRDEHSLEVQLPFLQYFLGDEFKIVPLVMGEQSPDLARKMAQAIVPLINDKTLLVASSDLSHYHGYEIANKMDEAFARNLEFGDIDRLWQGIRSRETEACGIGPIMTVLEATKHLGENRQITIFDHRNSGDTAGDRQKVVGYLSAGIFEN